MDIQVTMGIHYCSLCTRFFKRIWLQIIYSSLEICTETPWCSLILKVKHPMLLNNNYYWSVIQQFFSLFDFKTFIHREKIVSRISEKMKMKIICRSKKEDKWFWSTYNSLDTCNRIHFIRWWLQLNKSFFLKNSHLQVFYTNFTEIFTKHKIWHLMN